MDYDYIVDASDLNKEIKFVTGSNSTLLSGELAALLTGRTVEFEIFPPKYYQRKLLVLLRMNIYQRKLLVLLRMNIYQYTRNCLLEFTRMREKSVIVISLKKNGCLMELLYCMEALQN